MNNVCDRWRLSRFSESNKQESPWPDLVDAQADVIFLLFSFSFEPPWCRCWNQKIIEQSHYLDVWYRQMHKSLSSPLLACTVFVYCTVNLCTGCSRSLLFQYEKFFPENSLFSKRVASTVYILLVSYWSKVPLRIVVFVLRRVDMMEKTLKPYANSQNCLLTVWPMAVDKHSSR